MQPRGWGVGRAVAAPPPSDSARSQPCPGLPRVAWFLAAQPNGERADGSRGGAWAVAEARRRGTWKSAAAAKVSVWLAVWLEPAGARGRGSPEAQVGRGGAVAPRPASVSLSQGEKWKSSVRVQGDQTDPGRRKGP